MKKDGRAGWCLALGWIILVQLACGIPVAVSDLGKVDCESRGGKWRQTVDSDGRLEEWCEMPLKGQPTPTISKSPDGCFPSRNAFHWSYSEHKSSSGTGGVTCNARFVFENRSTEPQLLVIYTSWDNNKMTDKGWDAHPVPVGEKWEKRVSRTIYKNGIITFDRVERLLVVRDSPECTNVVPNMQQATEWESQAVDLDEIPCP